MDYTAATTAIGASVADTQAFLLTLLASVFTLTMIVGGVTWLYCKLRAKTVGNQRVTKHEHHTENFYGRNLNF